MRKVNFVKLWEEFTYLKSYNKFYDDISIAKRLSSEEMFKSSDIVEIQGQNSNVTEETISDKKEMSESIYTESINDTETEYASVEDLLNMHMTASKVTTLISMIPNIINGQKYYNCTRARKKINFSFKWWILCRTKGKGKTKTKGKLGYNAPRDTSISHFTS